MDRVAQIYGLWAVYENVSYPLIPSTNPAYDSSDTPIVSHGEEYQPTPLIRMFWIFSDSFLKVLESFDEFLFCR